VTGEKCASGKRVRRTFTEAAAAALRLSRQRGYGLRAYRCPDCDGWHLTKRPADRSRGAA